MNKKQIAIQLSYKEKCKQQDLHISALELEIKELQKKYNELNNDKKYINSKNIKLQKELENITAQNNNLKEKNKALTDKIKKQSINIDNMNNTLNSVTKDEWLEYRKSNDRNSIINRINEIDKKCRKTIKDNKELIVQISEYQAYINKLQNKMNNFINIILPIVRNYLINAYKSIHIFSVKPDIIDCDLEAIKSEFNEKYITYRQENEL